VKNLFIFSIGLLPWFSEASAETLYKTIKKDTLISPSGSFSIEQKYCVGSEGDWLFQSWLCPRKSDSYQLKLWHGGEISWAPYFFISPNERWIFYTQKTGSGDNYGEVFFREKNGFCSYKLMDHPYPSPSFSDAAFDFLGKKESLKLTLYHNGAEFVSWGKDGICLEISLNGTDCYEDYYSP
jgi:hypothetical protein